MFEPNNIPCMFVGYLKASKAYQFYNPKTRKIIDSRDVIFDEGGAYVQGCRKLVRVGETNGTFDHLLYCCDVFLSYLANRQLNGKASKETNTLGEETLLFFSRRIGYVKGISLLGGQEQGLESG